MTRLSPLTSVAVGVARAAAVCELEGEASPKAAQSRRLWECVEVEVHIRTNNIDIK